MDEKRTSPLCKSLYCEKGSIPLYMLVFLFMMGFLLAFLWDYVLLLGLTMNGSFPTICIGGIHIHHLYIGLGIFLISLIAFFIVKNNHRIWIIFFVGLGIGLAISDFITHITYDPFLCYC